MEHILLVEGKSGRIGDETYALNVHPIVTVTDGLVLNQTVTGDLVTPGMQHEYTFSIAEPSLFHFDSLTDNSGISWSLNTPSPVQRSFNKSDSNDNSQPVLSLLAGDYTLTIDGAGDTTGEYAFRFVDLAIASPVTRGHASMAGSNRVMRHTSIRLWSSRMIGSCSTSMLL